MRKGLVLFYVDEEGILYPTALTNEQAKMMNVVVANTLGKVKVIKDKPQGKLTELKTEGIDE